MNLGWALLAVAVGAGLTIQIGMNAAVRTAFGSPIAASIVNFTIGLAALAIVAVASAVRWQPAAAAAVPGWAWFGGLIGAAYVSSMVMLGPKLGATAVFALALLGQLAAALVVDHYGVLGFPHSPITPWRLLGAVLLLVGVALILRR
jgi:transporter family-2 protein